MTDYVAEARKLRVSIVQLAQYAPDEVAATAAFAFDPWDAAGTYEVGDRVQYADLLYKCLTGHTAQESWTPDVSPSLWAKVLIPDPSVIPEWEQPGSTNGYVIDFLKKHGYILDDERIEALIESAVFEMKNGILE